MQIPYFHGNKPQMQSRRQGPCFELNNDKSVLQELANDGVGGKTLPSRARERLSTGAKKGGKNKEEEVNQLLAVQDMIETLSVHEVEQNNTFPIGYWP